MGAWVAEPAASRAIRGFAPSSLRRARARASAGETARATGVCFSQCGPRPHAAAALAARLRGDACSAVTQRRRLPFASPACRGPAERRWRPSSCGWASSGARLGERREAACSSRLHSRAAPPRRRAFAPRLRSRRTAAGSGTRRQASHTLSKGYAAATQMRRHATSVGLEQAAAAFCCTAASSCWLHSLLGCAGLCTLWVLSGARERSRSNRRRPHPCYLPDTFSRPCRSWPSSPEE